MAEPIETTRLQPPPTDDTFDNFDQAFNFCQGWASEQGYAVAKLNTRKAYTGGPYASVFIRCDRGSKYKSTALIRKSTTRATDCPFKIQIKLIRSESQYQIIHHEPTHNHSPSWTPTAHPVHRRVDQYTRDIIESETQAGVKPKQILARIARETPYSRVRRKEVYNTIQDIRKETLQGSTPIEALVNLLESSDKWISRHRVDTEGRLTHLFFAYTKTLRIFQSHPDLLMADCTYRTNKFKMPLLHFIGCNSIGGHFTAAFCFLPGETESDYYWALQTLRELLYDPIRCRPHIFLSDNEQALRSACGSVWPDIPQLLCIWHINKAVQTQLQKHIRQVIAPFDPGQEEKNKKETIMKAWMHLNRAHTEAEYERRWAAFQQDYIDYRPFIRYLRDYQYPFRRFVATPWTSQYRHFNNITTSRLESNHRQAKDCLLSTRGHLLDVVQKLENYWETHYREYEARLASQYIQFAPNLNAKIIEGWDNRLNEFITPYALERCREQLTLARDPMMTPHCTGRFTSIWGIPCCHDLRAWLQAKRSVTPEDFDVHWLWEREGLQNVFQRGAIEAEIRIPAIYDPLVVRRNGGQTESRTTHRILSQFELSDLDRRTPGGRSSGTPSSTLGGTPNSAPVRPSDPLGSRMGGSQTPSVVMSRESVPPTSLVDPALSGALSPTPMTGSQPSSVGSTPAPTSDFDAGTPAPSPHLTYHSGLYSPAPPSTPSSSNQRLSLTMEPPAKRRRAATGDRTITKRLKEEAVNRVVLAWSVLGQPPNLHQMRAITSTWSQLLNTDVVAGRIVSQLILSGHPATPAQTTALIEALRPRPEGS